MALLVIDPESPLKPDDISAAEKRTGLHFPPAYRNWLLRYNGGHPIPGEFTLKGSDAPESSVAWFFAIHAGEYENFEKEHRFWKVMTGRVPGDLIPIARDGFGNLICLSFGGRDEGRVFFWDHEAETDPPSDANRHLIADTFDEFIEMLGRDLSQT